MRLRIRDPGFPVTGSGSGFGPRLSERNVTTLSIDSGSRIQDPGFRVKKIRDPGFRVTGSDPGLRDTDPGFRTTDSESEFQDSGLRVRDPGFGIPSAFGKDRDHLNRGECL